MKITTTQISFEERADQLSLEDITNTLVDDNIFGVARKALLAKGAKLLVGPRGTGKTHTMRNAYSIALKDSNQPIAVYATFNRYLNLEPMLNRQADSMKRFHSWVLAKLLLGCFQALHDSKSPSTCLTDAEPLFDSERLNTLVTHLERRSESSVYEDIGQFLTIDLVHRAFEIIRVQQKRQRVVVFLDDAALSLVDEFLAAFFEIFRLLKTETVSPKASVYPGSTQYGPTFHVAHESQEVMLWLDVTDPTYLTTMGKISNRRLKANEKNALGEDTLDAFKYLSFGIPRAYLRLLREFMANTAGSSQSRMNKVVESHVELIRTEYESLGLKLNQFASIIRAGEEFFDATVDALVEAKKVDAKDSHRNIILGLNQGIEKNQLQKRMLGFLVEVGMIHKLAEVNHGPGRRYIRFIPHLAFIASAGLFRQGKGSSASDVCEYMKRPAKRQPVRRDLSKLLNSQAIEKIKLDLPPCQKCSTARLNEAQRYCHACGTLLIIVSKFEECMKLKLSKVPGISPKLAGRLKAEAITTVEQVMASQDPTREVRAAKMIGPIRAQKIVEQVSAIVEEFLA